MRPEKLENLCTPFALLRKEILINNLQRVATNFRNKRISLRPHIKTHKCAEIALLQMSLGACGITVATVSEAEFMIRAGIENIFIARPVIGQPDFKKLAELAKNSTIIYSVDSLFHLEELEKHANYLSLPAKIRIEINSGHNRCGIKPEELHCSDILSHIKDRAETFNLDGVYTHAGQVYSKSDPIEIKLISDQECSAVIEASAIIQDRGLPCQTISVGTTPTAWFVDNHQITEVRPGNYSFNDGIQISNRTASIDDCAMRIIARVIGIYSDHIVIDAGSKALGLDRGAHGVTSVEGFGTILNYPDLIISRLSEEHGIVINQGIAGKAPAAGELLEIIPNHSCAAANLFSCFHVVSESETNELWQIGGRR